MNALADHVEAALGKGCLLRGYLASQEQSKLYYMLVTTKECVSPFTFQREIYCGISGTHASCTSHVHFMGRKPSKDVAFPSYALRKLLAVLLQLTFAVQIVNRRWHPSQASSEY